MDELQTRLASGSLSAEDNTRLQDLEDELDTLQAEIELNEVGCRRRCIMLSSLTLLFSFCLSVSRRFEFMNIPNKVNHRPQTPQPPETGSRHPSCSRERPLFPTLLLHREKLLSRPLTRLAPLKWIPSSSYWQI
jgi:hypothetical protein